MKIPLPTTLTWQSHVERWRNCQECDLCTQRGRVVLARGDIPCDLLFIGEAPGESEDVRGVPFWGPAGQLLDQIVRAALADYRHLRVAFTNLVACFPAEAKRRGDNEPELAEIKACATRLREFVELCQPKLIVAVGALANEFLPYAVGRPGERYTWEHITHPAAIKRMPIIQQDMAARRCVSIIQEAIAARDELLPF